MREIKFRGKSKLTSEWVYGYYSVRGGEHFISFMNDNHQWQDVGVIPETVGQFTNLPDKNGKEIYEGDIMSHYNGEFFSEVIFDRGTFMMRRSTGDYHFDFIKTIEVIGNIWENGGLLK